MKISLLRPALALAALLASSGAFAAQSRVVDAINREVGEGKLDRGRAALYRLYEMRAPEKLPPALTGRHLHAKAGAVEEDSDRCATLGFLQARAALPRMDGETFAEARELIDPDPAPSARTATLNGGAKLVTHKLSFHVETDNFSIEWGPDLTNEDGTTPVLDLDHNGIPDVAERWASYFEYAYSGIRGLGFNDVPTLDEYKVVVLIANSDPSTLIDNLSSGYYGVTNGELPHPAGTPPAYIVVTNNMGRIVTSSPNDESSKGFVQGMRGAMMVTAAHELNHVFQFLYAPNAWHDNTVFNTVNWYLEATSTWLEDEIYPFVNDYKQYFGPTVGWQNFPETTLAIYETRIFSNQQVKVSRTYGSSIFNKYLSEHVGGPAAVGEVWKALKAGISFTDAVGDAADAAAGTSGVWTMDDVFLGFAGANATMDYDDGSLYGTSPARSRASPTSTPLPEVFGSSYVDNSVQTAVGRRLDLTSFAPAANWGVGAVALVDTADEKGALVLGAKTQSLDFLPPDGSRLTTFAAFFGPSLVTTSFKLDLSAGSLSDVTPPTQLQLPAVEAKPTGFRVQWTPAADDVKLGGYLVQYRPVGQVKWSSRTILGQLGEATVRELAPDTPMEVRVAAYDAAGNVGTASPVATVTTGPAYGYPPAIAFNLSQPPVLNPIGSKAVTEGQTLSFTVTATDPDTPVANLVYSALQLPTGASFNQSTRVFTWTPTLTQSGSYGVSFAVYDGSTSVWEKIVISVLDANPPTSGSSGSGSAGGCFLEALPR